MIPSVRHKSSVGACAVFLLLLGCESPLAPDDVIGTYSLRSVASRSLPTELYRNESVLVRVFADTLRLFPDGTATIATRRETSSLNASSAATSRFDVTQARYQLQDTSVEITFECRDTANCAAGPHLIATKVGSDLYVDYVLIGHVALSYARVDERP